MTFQDGPLDGCPLSLAMASRYLERTESSSFTVPAIGGRGRSKLLPALLSDTNGTSRCLFPEDSTGTFQPSPLTSLGWYPGVEFLGHPLWGLEQLLIQPLLAWCRLTNGTACEHTYYVFIALIPWGMSLKR